MSRPIVPLGELCDMDRQGLRPDDPIASGLPFVGVEHLESGSGVFNFNNGSRIGSQRSTTFRFDDRHVLYAKLRPYLNKVATPEFSGRCSTELVPLLPRDGVDREFLAYLLRRKETVEYVMTSVSGSRMPRTDMKALMSLPVPLPRLDEQRRIVGILNRAAKIERLRARAAERLREFIPALFVRMFGDPDENPIGMSVYPQVCLDQLVTVIESGFACSKSNIVMQGMLHLRPFNIGQNGDVDLTQEYRMPSELIPPSKAYLCAGDILFNNTNSADLVGKTAVVHENLAASFSNHVTRIRLDLDRCDPMFIATYMRQLWLQGHFRNHCTQWVNQAAFGTRLLARLHIPLPPIDEQRRFAGLAAQTALITDNARIAADTAAGLSTSLVDQLLESGT